MAGTRLAAHSCFLGFALISVLVAWRLGLVKRAALPLKEMTNPSISAKSLLNSGPDETLPLPVDIDVVLLRSPADGGCPSCTAKLNAIQANPSLARVAFLDVAAVAAAEGARGEDVVDATVRGRNGTSAASRSPSETAGEQFSIRTVNLRVAHANRGFPVASDDLAELDDWLYQSFIPMPSTRARTLPFLLPLVPTYTFFVGCSGGARVGELPAFVMGKRRHGYLALGCDDDYCGDRGGSEVGAAGREGVLVAPGPRPEVVAGAAAVTEVLKALAGVVVAHVLRTPVPAGDVHVRLGQAYRLNFSLLSEDPVHRRCTWDFAAASRRYLRPMLRKLEPVASFAVQSQEVLYARLVPAPPRKYSAMNRWYYSPFDLQSFLGANDFSTLDLAAGWETEDTAISTGRVSRNSVSAVPTPQSQVPVNFMVFCPTPKHNPLVFMEDWAGAGGRNRPTAEAFEVPGFGGVSVVNIDDAAAGQGGDVDALGPDRLRRALGAHASQLRRIIGLPRSSDMPSEVPWPRLQKEELNEGTVDRTSSNDGEGSCVVAPSNPGDRSLPLTFLPSPTDGVTDWEVDALLRAGLVRNRAAAFETIRSLAALVESQPEMEVSTKVAEDVVAALRALAEIDTAVSATWLDVPSGNVREVMAVNAAATSRGTGTRARGESKIAGDDEKQAGIPAERDINGNGNGSGPPGTGRDWAGAVAMLWAREALRRSEAAYFDPTMVPQLYFPEDHLMAVYLPFLGPLAFPLLVGFVQELVRYYRKKRRGKREKDGEEEEGDKTTSSGTGGTAR